MEVRFLTSWRSCCGNRLVLRLTSGTTTRMIGLYECTMSCWKLTWNHFLGCMLSFQHLVHLSCSTVHGTGHCEAESTMRVDFWLLWPLNSVNSAQLCCKSSHKFLCVPTLNESTLISTWDGSSNAMLLGTLINWLSEVDWLWSISTMTTWWIWCLLRFQVLSFTRGLAITGFIADEKKIRIWGDPLTDFLAWWQSLELIGKKPKFFNPWGSSMFVWVANIATSVLRNSVISIPGTKRCMIP